MDSFYVNYQIQLFQLSLSSIWYCDFSAIEHNITVNYTEVINVIVWCSAPFCHIVIHISHTNK